MGVYTKTGDKGQTSLYTGQRVDKDSIRVETYGTIDEMNSALGMARAFCENKEVKQLILALQRDIPNFMADLASVGARPMINEYQGGRDARSCAYDCAACRTSNAPPREG